MSLKKLIFLFVFAVFIIYPSRMVMADELSDLRSQVQAMQGQINALMNRIDQLENEKIQKTEAPVEIDDRVSALEEKMEKPLLSKMANAFFNMKGYIQSYYLWEEHDSGEDTFETRRLRLIFDGAITEDFSYKVQLDLAAGSDILRDATLTYKKLSWANVSIGQMLIPFSYRNLESGAKLDTIQAPLITGSISGVRDIGALLEGKILDEKLHYAVGVFNGSGKNVADNNENKDIVGRVVYSPFKNNDNEYISGLSIGGAVQSGRQPLSGNYEGSRDRYESLFLYAYDKLTLKGEYIHQNSERTGALSDEEAQGWYLSSVYKITSKIKGVVMYEQYDPDMDVSDNEQDILTLGGVYQFNDYVRLDLNFRQIFEQGANEDTNNEIIFQTQVEF